MKHKFRPQVELLNERVVPAVLTFSFPNGSAGQATFAVPGASIDPADPHQIIALEDFTAVVDGFPAERADDNPTITFEKGVYAGLSVDVVIAKNPYAPGQVRLHVDSVAVQLNLGSVVQIANAATITDRRESWDAGSPWDGPLASWIDMAYFFPGSIETVPAGVIPLDPNGIDLLTTELPKEQWNPDWYSEAGITTLEWRNGNLVDGQNDDVLCVSAPSSPELTPHNKAMKEALEKHTQGYMEVIREIDRQIDNLVKEVKALEAEFANRITAYNILLKNISDDEKIIADLTAILNRDGSLSGNNSDKLEAAKQRLAQNKIGLAALQPDIDAYNAAMAAKYNRMSELRNSRVHHEFKIKQFQTYLGAIDVSRGVDVNVPSDVFEFNKNADGTLITNIPGYTTAKPIIVAPGALPIRPVYAK